MLYYCSMCEVIEAVIQMVYSSQCIFLCAAAIKWLFVQNTENYVHYNFTPIYPCLARPTKNEKERKYTMP